LGRGVPTSKGREGKEWEKGRKGMARGKGGRGGEGGKIPDESVIDHSFHYFANSL